MAATFKLHLGCDERVPYSGAYDDDTETFLNSGTCEYAIYKRDESAENRLGDAVPGGTGTLPYVTGSDGKYRGIIDGAITATLTLDAWYVVVITFSQGNYDDKRYLEAQAMLRGR